jgi:hypothetical protein
MPAMGTRRSGGRLGSASGWLSVFALPFAAVGVFMSWLTVRTMWLAYEMRRWREVPAVIESAGLNRRLDSDGSTYKAVAGYRYELNGTAYTGHRVSIHRGSDNIGAFQRRAYEELSRHKDSGEPFRCYVNPDDPADSVLYRAPRWELIGFYAMFGVAFGGAGFGLLIGSARWRRRMKAQASQKARNPDAPWLWNPDWAGGVIKSSSKLEMLALLLFAALWNAIALPIAILTLTDGHPAQERARLFVLIFPLIGAGLAAWAALAVLRYRKYGVSTLRLSKIPGVIGGPLEGVVHVPVRVKPDGGFRVALKCIHRYTTGSGKNRNTREDVLWEDERVMARELLEGGPAGSAIPVLFGIPRDCRPTEADEADDQIVWRLELKAKTAGPDYASRFEVPVFVTRDSSADFRLDESPIERYAAKVEPAQVCRESGVQVRPLPGGMSFYFPPARQKAPAAFMTFFFLIWTGAVAAMYRFHAPRFMTFIFGLTDLAVFWGVLTLWLDRRRVEIAPQGITLSGGILGLGRPRLLRRDEIADVVAVAGMRAGSQSYHNLELRTRAGKSFTIGARIPGKRAADVVAAEIRKAVG